MNPDQAQLKRMVLVVDDQAPVAMCFRRSRDRLVNCGVIAPPGGSDTLRHFVQRPLDVLVTDSIKSVMLAEGVRRMYPETVMIMVTTLIGEALADPRTRELFEHVLSRPVEMEALCALVLKALDGASGTESVQAIVDASIGGARFGRNGAILQ